MTDEAQADLQTIIMTCFDKIEAIEKDVKRLQIFLEEDAKQIGKLKQRITDLEKWVGRNCGL